MSSISGIDSLTFDESMPVNPDPRRIAGAQVNAKAVHPTSEAQCARWYGSLSKFKRVGGTELKVVIDRSGGRASTSFEVEWDSPSR